MNFWLVIFVFLLNFFYVYYVIKLERSNQVLRETKDFKDLYSDLEKSCPVILNSSSECNFPSKKYQNWREIPNICFLFASECKNSLHFFGEEENLNYFWSDFIFIDFVLTKHFEFKNFLEIGTGSGIQSLYYGLITRSRRGKFNTFDENDFRSQRIKRGWTDNMMFHKINFDKDTIYLDKYLKTSNAIFFSVGNCKLFQMMITKLTTRTILFINMKLVDQKCIRKHLSKNHFSDVYKKFSNHFASKYQSFVKIR